MPPTLGRLIECQMAFVTWGMKAKFRQGKLGLLRKDNKVFLAIFFTKTEHHKLLVDPKSLTILPAAIRFKDMQKDLFIRNVADNERYEHMKRGIKVLLRKDEIRRTGKGDKLDRFIESLPQLNSISLEERAPPVRISLNLSSLELVQCNLEFIPKELEDLSRSLKHLDMSRNNITNLPRTFCCKMSKLSNLNLSHNLIETLPLEIKFLSKLVVLNISYNNLRLLPSTFSDLRALKILNVANNNLSQLPAFRRSDITLDTLDISSNPLDGALQNQMSTFEVYPSYDGQLGYEETSFSPSQANLEQTDKKQVPKLFEISLLTIVRSDPLFKLASEEDLPRSIVSTMQRDIFKCYRCNQMHLLPAFNSTDYLEYVAHVTNLVSSRNYSHGMTFMKLICRDCFASV
uniref:Leucine-rich repeat-containing protein 57 n=1 Tax=Aceria tosichella TaxID=561515 RepID=A0A6G1S3F9_9ACAR